ncbi:unnamed protein product [Amaranthus hypochondriacus]
MVKLVDYKAHNFCRFPVGKIVIFLKQPLIISTTMLTTFSISLSSMKPILLHQFTRIPSTFKSTTTVPFSLFRIVSPATFLFREDVDWISSTAASPVLETQEEQDDDLSSSTSITSPPSSGHQLRQKKDVDGEIPAPET